MFFGALLLGVLADAFGTETAILSIGILTGLSAVAINLRMTCKTDNCLSVRGGNLEASA